MTEATLLYLQKNYRVLLFEKQKKIGAGKLNGVGGKMEPEDKTIVDTMIRESQEEMKVTPTTYKKMAEIAFHNCFDDDTLQKMNVHVFTATEWEGEPTATDEMKKPGWHDVDNLPFEQMLPDDEYWLPQVLAGQAIKAFFKFDKAWNIIEKNVEEIDGFDLENK